MSENGKLRPVESIDGGGVGFYRPNVLQQNILLKALSVTTDPQKLKEMAGFRNVAEVYRTLDKLSMRKEYHAALAKHGLTLDIIVSGLKDICNNAKNENVKLQGYKTILKSIGLDEYKESGEEAGKNWEDALQEHANELEGKVVYEVDAPKIPYTEEQQIKKEKAIGANLYE